MKRGAIFGAFAKAVHTAKSVVEAVTGHHTSFSIVAGIIPIATIARSFWRVKGKKNA